MRVTHGMVQQATNALILKLHRKPVTEERWDKYYAAVHAAIWAALHEQESK